MIRFKIEPSSSFLLSDPGIPGVRSMITGLAMFDINKQKTINNLDLKSEGLQSWIKKQLTFKITGLAMFNIKKITI